jgi:hypothetical protein
MARKPSIIFDYEYLASKDDEDVPREVFLLSESSQWILSELAEMVLWWTRWENGTDEQIRTLAHDIYEELKVPYHLDDLIPLVDEVEDLLRALQQLGGGCCPGNYTYLPLTPVPDSGYDYEDGPFPGTWGESETVADLADYQQLLCYQYHLYVDYLAGIGEQLDQMIASSALVVGAIAGILGVLAGAGILMPIAYASAAGISTGIVASWTANLFLDASDAIEAARGDIICAMISGEASALEAVIEGEISALAWSLFFQHINYADAIEIIETGGVNGEFLDVGRRADCGPCGPPIVPSGLYFQVTSGTVIDELDGDSNPHETEMNYGQSYRFVGTVGTVFDLELRTSIGGPDADATMHVTDFDCIGSCGFSVACHVFDKGDVSLVETIELSECGTYTGDVALTHHIKHYCTNSGSTPRGYIECYFSAT